MATPGESSIEKKDLVPQNIRKDQAGRMNQDRGLDTEYLSFLTLECKCLPRTQWQAWSTAASHRLATSQLCCPVAELPQPGHFPSQSLSSPSAKRG